MVDELSMTKITLHPDQAAFAAEVLEVDQSRGGRFEPVAPLHHHGSLVQQLVQAEIPQLRLGLDALEVDMSELHPPRVHPNQLKGGTCNKRVRRRATCHTTDKSGLSRSQLAGQQD